MGCWGPATASLDWCEPSYVWSAYVAEAWSTVSAQPVCATAWCAENKQNSTTLTNRP